MPKVTTQRDPGPFACQAPGCGKVFIRRNDLTRHARQHDPSTKRLKCSQCNHTTIYKDNLKTHFIGRHVNRKAYVCRFTDCQKAYTDDSSLIKHEKKIHDFFRKAQRPYVRPPALELRLQVHSSMFVQGSSNSHGPSSTTSSGDEQFDFDQYLDEILGLCKSSASGTCHTSSTFLESHKQCQLDSERPVAANVQKVNTLSVSVPTCQYPVLDQDSELFGAQAPSLELQGLEDANLRIDTWNTMMQELLTE